MIDKTLPMGIGNTPFLVDKLGSDCGPLQYIRELTQNGIEAIQRSGKAGEIIWDIDWPTYELDGGVKLCITDTGVGMTGEELIKYINNLSSSGGVQSSVANYGSGAKIAAATRNPEGLLYLSWRSNIGVMAHLRRDSKGIYGLKQFDLGEGEVSYTPVAPDDFKPGNIKEHGTKVVLLGKTPNEDTFQPPAYLGIQSKTWLIRHLNSRYFDLPENITLRVREAVNFDSTPVNQGSLRRITGMKQILSDVCSKHGQVGLTGATAHWWLIGAEDDQILARYSQARAGHTAALYQNELYEISPPGKTTVASLQQFGVIFGYNKVVIYVEPTEFVDLTTNTARTHLLLREQPLPWADWQAEFRKGMPKELKEHIINSSPKAASEKIASKIERRLEEMGDILKPSAYRLLKPTDFQKGEDIGTEKTQAGPHDKVDEDVSNGGTSPRPGSGPRFSPGIQPGTNSSPDSGIGPGIPKSPAVVPAGDIYALFAKGKGQFGRPVKTVVMPKPQFVTIADGSRTAGDLEDRAARYLPDQNILLINADFRALTDLISVYQKKYSNPEHTQAITDTVREWYQQGLIEAVVGARTLSQSPAWTAEDIGKLFSEEALTMTAMQRYLTFKTLNRVLAIRFGASNDVTDVNAGERSTVQHKPRAGKARPSGVG